MAVPVRIEDHRKNSFPRMKRPPGKRNGNGIWLIMIFIALLMSGIPMKIYNDLTANQHDKIKEYLGQREQYFSSSDLEFKQLLNKVYQLNTTNISSITPDIQQAKIVILNNYQSVSELKPPKAFQDLHNETLKWFIDKNSAIDYLEMAAINNSYDPNSFQLYINRMNETLSHIKPRLIQGLQESKLQYRINADGSIVYWLQTNEFGQ